MRDKRVSAAVIAGLFVVAAALCALSYFGVGRQHEFGARNIKQGLDLQGGVSVVYEAGKTNPTSEEMNAVEAMIRGRLDRRGWTEAEVARQGSRRIRIEIPGVEDAQTAIKEIGSTAHLTFRDQEGNILVDGKDVSNATKGAQNNQLSGAVEWVVHLEFTAEGKQAFADATRNNVGNPIGIYLDEDLISNPNVNEAITDGSAVISGSFTTESADELASLIKAGALPFSLNSVLSSYEGAKLGANSLETSLLAGFIGIICVMLFMVFVYRVAGLMADIALLMYTGLMLVLLSAMGVTLTLPGIAGIILSIGMAIDANIIIFERLKEELIAKKTMRVAVQSAFKRAFSAILDSNVTTLIAAGVLYWLGTGPVKGFAQTLALGIVVSMFTAIFITRLLMTALVGLGAKNPKLFRMGLKDVEAVTDGEKTAVGALTAKDESFKIVDKRNTFFLISGVVIAVGIVFMIVHGASGKGIFNFDVEFTGGLAMELDVGTSSFDKSDIAAIIEEKTSNATNPQVSEVMSDPTHVTVKMREMSEDDHLTVISGLQEKYPLLEELTSESVSGTVSVEMQRAAIIAVLVASLAMLLYITFRFRDVALGGACILGILHDALIMLAGYALLRISVNYAFIAALLTVLGYSINASIVMFDRLRENKRLLPNISNLTLINVSIRQTLTRSIYTTLTTLITVVMMIILGGSSIKDFLIPIFIGLVSGTYSSLCLAGGLWFVLQRRFNKKNA